MLENTKEEITSCKSKKDKEYNDKNIKRATNDLLIYITIC